MNKGGIRTMDSQEITDAQVQSFMDAAGQAGDIVAVAVCQMAMGVTVRELDEHDAYRFELIDLDNDADKARRCVAGMIWEGQRGFQVGDRVESGSGEDYDTGRIVAMAGSVATVAWDGGAVRTSIDVAYLRAS